MRTCLIGTVYALLLYILGSTDEEVRRTRFVFQKNIPASVRACFPEALVFWETGLPIWKKLVLALAVPFRAARLRRAGERLFAQDHIFAAPFIIGRRSYVLLADAPKCYSTLAELYLSRHQRWSRVPLNVLRRLVGAPMYGSAGGQNPQCTGVWLGEPDDSPVLGNLPRRLLPIAERMQSASPFRRELVGQMFGLGAELRRGLAGRDVIVLTQPYWSDGVVDYETHLRIYREALSEYPASRVVIKPHPRDKVDYEQAFPEYAVMKTAAPFQLLTALGFDFRVAVTVSSTAVTALPEAEIVWIGNSVDPRILAKYGRQDAVLTSLKNVRRLRE